MKRDGRSKHPLYATWQNMIDRCYNERSKHFRKYGGRVSPIQVCDCRRNDFWAFVRDMHPKPKGYSIERLDNSLGYFAGNVTWATRKTQNRNTSRNHHISAFGETLPIAEWTERTGIHRVVIHLRLKRGWSPEDAVAKPVATKFRGRWPAKDLDALRQSG